MQNLSILLAYYLPKLKWKIRYLNQKNTKEIVSTLLGNGPDTYPGKKINKKGNGLDSQLVFGRS